MNRASAGGEESLPLPLLPPCVFSPCPSLITRPKQEGQGGLKLSIQGLMERVINFLQPRTGRSRRGEQSWATFPFVEEVGENKKAPPLLLLLYENHLLNQSHSLDCSSIGQWVNNRDC